MILQNVCLSKHCSLVQKYCLSWCRTSESARVTQPTVWHDHVIMPAAYSDITSGSPLSKDLTPRAFPHLVSALSSCGIGDSYSCSPDVELCPLTKWLPSRMLLWVSRQASLQCRHSLVILKILYIFYMLDEQSYVDHPRKGKGWSSRFYNCIFFRDTPPHQHTQCDCIHQVGPHKVTQNPTQLQRQTIFSKNS